MLKKSVFALPVIGTLLYLIAVSFVVFAFNYPQGGFSFSLQVTYAIYICYLIIMFFSLIIGCVSLIKTKFDSIFQRLGPIIFLAGVVLSITHFIMFYISLFTTFNFPLSDIMSLSILYPSISLILLIVGIIMSRYPFGKQNQ